MNKIYPLLLSIVLILQNGIARQSQINPEIKNESKLNYLSIDSPPRGDDVRDATFCKGSVDTCMYELEKIGITKADLEKEVYCTVGDFDGNGYLDFTIWGANKQKNKWPDYENYLVLFFEQTNIIKSISINSGFPGHLLVHYPPRPNVGPNGEPVSKNDALWLIGETDGYDDESKGIVYIYNSETGEFDKKEFGNKRKAADTQNKKR